MARDLTQFYYKLVKNGKMDIEEVPEKYREAVRALLDE